MPYYPPTSGQTNIVTSNVPAPVKKVNPQTTNDYTLKADDTNSLITFENALPVMVTLPDDSAANIPVGSVVELMQLGEGKVSVRGTSITIKSQDSQKSLKTQYSQATLLKVAANTWVLTGDISA